MSNTFDEHIEQAARRYVDGLQKAGLKPNPTLDRAMAERAVREAQAACIEEARIECRERIKGHIEAHNQRMNEIKRSGARLRMITCPPIAVLFGLVAWYNFTCPPEGEGFFLGVLFLVGAAAFIAMLIGGAIFDRPVQAYAERAAEELVSQLQRGYERGEG